jgi:transposase-like protein
MADTVLTPSQAADELGIKSSTLRKYALAYEKTFGPLPRGAQHNRLYPAMVLQRLSAARTLIEERRAANLEVALQSLNGDMTLE